MVSLLKERSNMAVLDLINDKVKISVANGDYSIKCTDDVAEISMRFHERGDGYNRLSHLDIKFRQKNVNLEIEKE